MTQADESEPIEQCEVARPLQYLIERNGRRFAGIHLLVDMWDANNLSDIDIVRTALRRAAMAANARLLQIELHHYPDGDGVTGIAVLAESHISVHTWPECNFVAIDLFMCGRASPRNAIPVLESVFRPGRIEVQEFMRGELA